VSLSARQDLATTATIVMDAAGRNAASGEALRPFHLALTDPPCLNRAMRVLIVGCGYVGVPLGAELSRMGHEVYGLRRTAAASAELMAAGIRPLAGDATRLADLRALPAPFDWVVNTLSASGRGVPEYRQAYLDGTGCLIEWLVSTPLKKFVYTSSTGVYAQEDGSMVKETSPTEPASETGWVLVQAEQLLLEAVRARQFPAVILRVAGIYGPGRGHWFKQFIINEARIDGKGERIMNMIHRDDVAGCIMAALSHGRIGEIYNAVDDEPVTQLHYFQWLAATLGKWMPPAASPEVSADARTRGGNKRVSNRRIKMELGYQFRHPTFREGYTSEIARLQAVGELEIKPDPR
jgi:nucleoside-diphosphate-sugar epimerase